MHYGFYLCFVGAYTWYLWALTLLHDVCTLCDSLGFVGHTLALCYYLVHYGLSLWVVVVPIL